ncbi:hypothetical protein [Caulobacter sp. UNC279MFTsu5.1]|uniref:ECs_2282 family putative zinc-binding protein n=1 Tax=Caulobacter sp. UNC279MFTsu5.1 TaxID=1502775 RepID=UPI0008F1A1EA|nr:hypothetical protein [Caulobacter sp. UNC279MFTsu5.1]SFI55481.1 hypothetical protein SAMN02799626_00112 [Caulobacter sp. UNC279MFTsu5.1]
MSLKDHSRSIGLRCSTCGGADFKRDPALDDGPIECATCERVFSRDELIRENGEIIDNAVDEVKTEIVADFKAELRKAFRGSKFIKIR